MNFNPFQSSMFTGAGLPWGAKQEQGPDYTKFDTNPDNYQGFNSSELRRAMERRLALQKSAGEAQALAGLQKAGVKGADTTRALTDLAGQRELGQMDLEANLGLQDYYSRIANRDASQRLFENQQGWKGAQSQAEDLSRGSFWNNLMQAGSTVGGAIAGSYFGGKKKPDGVGAASGAQMDNMLKYNSFKKPGMWGG